MKTGVYGTYDGNAALVEGPRATVAWDLDMAIRIPISLVDPACFLRPAEGEDWDLID